MGEIVNIEIENAFLEGVEILWKLHKESRGY